MVRLSYSVKFIIYTVLVKCTVLRISIKKTKGVLFEGKFPFGIKTIIRNIILGLISDLNYLRMT